MSAFIAFAWDSAKAAINLRKHRVSFEEGTTVFDDPLASALLDADLMETFPDSSSVNRALRAFLAIPEWSDPASATAETDSPGAGSLPSGLAQRIVCSLCREFVVT